MMNIEIANRLVQLRKKNGYSQEELAARLGISRQAVSKWERAESSPDTDNLITLSRLYGISLDALLATEEEMPEAEEADAESIEGEGNDESKGEDGVHINNGGLNFNSSDGDRVYIGSKGIHVESDDGDTVHVGWDGIHVNKNDKKHSVGWDGIGVNKNDKKHSEECDAGYVEDDDYIDQGDISDIEIDESGVTFTENGERRHYDWNRFKHGKKSYYRKTQNPKSGRWRTVIIDEKGKKVFINSLWNSDEDSDEGISISRETVGGFPYVAFVTVAFLLLGFLGGWWHPAWLLFLTIPVYYPIANMVRHGGANALDIIVPTLLAGGYAAIGLLCDIWHPTWLILLGIPIYFAIAAVVRGKAKHIIMSVGWYPLLITLIYLALGFTLGAAAWGAGWLLYLTIPMFYSIVSSVRKGRGIRALSSFPWEVLITGLYLAGGILLGWWHPGWVIFIAIPIIRWFIKLIISAVQKR